MSDACTITCNQQVRAAGGDTVHLSFSPPKQTRKPKGMELIPPASRSNSVVSQSSSVDRAMATMLADSRLALRWMTSDVVSDWLDAMG